MHKITKYVYLFILTFNIILINRSYCQETVIQGKVTDATTNEPIPFANIIFRGTVIGTTTDFEGKYIIKTKQPKDSLTVQVMGYKTRSKHVKKNVRQFLDYQLMPSNIELEEVVIKSGENPAFRILRKVWKNKDKLNYDNLNAYQEEVYSKVEAEVDNTEGLKDSWLLKPFANVFDSLKLLAGEDGKALIPIFVSETFSEYYHLKTPYRKKELIKGSKILGVGFDKDDFVSQTVGNIYLQDYNFYNNFLHFFGKDFISPISSYGLAMYKYYLVDSLYIDGKYCWEIQYKPRQAADQAFTGTIWINDTSFALKRIVAEFGKASNVNFIQKFRIQQDLMPVDNQVWMPVKSRILVDIANPTKNTVGIIGKFHLYYNHFVINHPKPLKFYESPIVFADSAKNRDEDYWAKNRPEKLSPLSQHIYNLVDSIKGTPLIKKYIVIGKTLGMGYYDLGKIRIGPYPLVYGYSKYEGSRFRLGFTTDQDFSLYWVIKGYLAYGTTDQLFKYNLLTEVFLSRKNWTKIGCQYRFDVDGMGTIDPFFEKNAVFAISSQLGLYSFANRSELYRFWFMTDLFHNVQTKIYFTNKSFTPIGELVFAYYDDQHKIQSYFKTSELTCEIRYTNREIMMVNYNDRISSETDRSPVFTLDYTAGLKDVWGGDFAYNKVSLKVSQILRMGAFGRLNYSITGTKFFGQIPYPLLYMPPGNENIIESSSTYNLMNFMEFVTDESLEFKAEENFGGLIFNRIPLLKKLKWREIAGFKGIFGSWSQENKDIIPAIYHDPATNKDENVTKPNELNFKDPYVEVYYGVDNIFRFFRVDFIHRLTYLRSDVTKFGVKVSATIKI